MKVIQLKNILKADYRRIIKRSAGTNGAIIPSVRKIMNEVKEKGDQLILEKYQKRYGTQYYKSIRVTDAEIKRAYREVDDNTIKALNQMIKNISLAHSAQLPNTTGAVVQVERGIKVWRQWRAIEKVGLYVPGGKAIYPSSVLMTAIPAKIAGCKDIILCSPPGKDGRIPAPTIVAAKMVGMQNIFKVGGAEAIAAMTYGTKTIPNVYKIFGAGNSYVTAAKMMALETINIDMPAGPSEVFIIADETAKPSFIAADLLADGEHGEDSACVLVTTSEEIARQTVEELEKQLRTLPTQKRARESLKRYGLIAVVDTLDKALDFANEYAPEHLEIMTKNNIEFVAQIKNAGSIFVGDYTSKSSGDYATGANHVLPTGGMAKMYPPLGVDAFGKWMQVQECTKSGLQKIRETIETISKVEQLPAHKMATEIRFINS